MLNKHEERILNNRWCIYNDNKLVSWHRIETHNGKIWREATHSFDDLVELIHNTTCGKFFFGDNSIYFEQEKDAVLFRLKYTSKI